MAHLSRGAVAYHHAAHLSTMEHLHAVAAKEHEAARADECEKTEDAEAMQENVTEANITENVTENVTEQNQDEQKQQEAQVAEQEEQAAVQDAAQDAQQ